MASRGHQNLLFCLIARDQNVLVEFSPQSGNFTTVTLMLLSKFPKKDGKMSYLYDTCVRRGAGGARTDAQMLRRAARTRSHMFHYIREDGIIYLCMTDMDAKRRIAFAFLDDIKQRFKEKYGEQIFTANAFAMNQSFAPVIRRQMVGRQGATSLSAPHARPAPARLPRWPGILQRPLFRQSAPGARPAGRCQERHGREHRCVNGRHTPGPLCVRARVRPRTRPRAHRRVWDSLASRARAAEKILERGEKIVRALLPGARAPHPPSPLTMLRPTALALCRSCLSTSLASSTTRLSSLSGRCVPMPPSPPRAHPSPNPLPRRRAVACAPQCGARTSR